MGPDHHLDRNALLRRLTLMSAALVMASPALAQTSAPGTSRARILAPVNLSVTQELNFGSIIPSTTRASTVRVNQNETVTLGGGAVRVGATHASSRQTGSGTRNAVIIITRPPTIFLTGPGPRMRVRSWTLGTTSGLTRVTGNQYRITAVNGVFGFRLGATLDVARNQPEGEYQGSYTVTVNYQ